MRGRCLVSFTGLKLSMSKGRIADFQDIEVFNDLLSCGYIEEIKEEKPLKRGVKKNESK